jgi:DNA-binding LacI/PurR family transcriptional regulator
MPIRKRAKLRPETVSDGPNSPGMKEIAERVGVSKTTVHRALTGSGRISARTRERIVAVAAELDYAPNIVARSLRRQRTGTIGIITNGMSNSFYPSLLAAIEEAATGQGFSLLLACSSGSPEIESANIELLREKRVDGLLVSPASPVRNAADYERLKRAGVPFVYIDRFIPSVGADAVMTDHHLAGQIIASHLIGAGRRDIGVILPLNERQQVTSIQERMAGLMEVAGRRDARVTLIGDTAVTGPWEDYAAQSLGAFLDRGGRVDAVFGINDQIALGAMWACHNRGLRVPDHVAVVGYDDLEISSFVTPRLTTIRQPTRQIAWEAVKLLLSAIGSGRPEEPVHMRLRPTLMERESTPRVR